jgi:hypothetical protein
MVRTADVACLLPQLGLSEYWRAKEVRILPMRLDAYLSDTYLAPCAPVLTGHPVASNVRRQHDGGRTHRHCSCQQALQL